MNGRRTRVLVIAEAANPEWVSVPLVGWSLANALRSVADVHLVTQVRNREAIARAGLLEGRDFTSIDTEDLGRPLWKSSEWIKKMTGLGWTTSTAISSLPYYLFEHRVWQRFESALRAHQFDIVHRVTPLTPTTPSLIARRCRRAGVPFVWGPINGGVAWPKEFTDVLRAEGEWLSYVRNAYQLMPGYRSTRADASAIIVGSRATWSELAPFHDKCVYTPENAVDPTRFGEPAQLPASGPLRAAFVGRLVPYKGADMLLRAAAPLVRSGALEIDILGVGPQSSELEQLVRSEGLSRGVRMPGWIPHAEIHQRLRGCHLFTFPSVREFGGGVVVEAMLLGLVPVVIDYAGPAELVTDQTGFRIPLGTREVVIERLAKLLAELARDRSRLPALGRAARERVLDWFTWERKASQVNEVYAWVLGKRPKPAFGMPFPDRRPGDEQASAPDADVTCIR
jgi:glycosyltransferase involved in cell wall biosynthesis